MKNALPDLWQKLNEATQPLSNVSNDIHDFMGNPHQAEGVVLDSFFETFQEINLAKQAIVATLTLENLQLEQNPDAENAEKRVEQICFKIRKLSTDIDIFLEDWQRFRR